MASPALTGLEYLGLMDLIISIIALAAFYLIQVLASRRQRQQESPEPEADFELPRELSDALSEISEALGGKPERRPAPPAPGPGHSGSTTTGPPRPSPTGPPRPAPTGQARPAPTRPVPSPGRASTSASDEFHRVVTGRGDAEERFENAGSEFRPAVRPMPPPQKLKARSMPPRGAPKRKPSRLQEDRFEKEGMPFGDPLAGHDHIPGLDEQVPEGVAREISGPFQSQKELRNAVIAAEILGPPRALKGFGRR